MIQIWLTVRLPPVLITCPGHQPKFFIQNSQIQTSWRSDHAIFNHLNMAVILSKFSCQNYCACLLVAYLLTYTYPTTYLPTSYLRPTYVLLTYYLPTYLPNYLTSYLLPTYHLPTYLPTYLPTTYLPISIKIKRVT